MTKKSHFGVALVPDAPIGANFSLSNVFVKICLLFERKCTMISQMQNFVTSVPMISWAQHMGCDFIRLRNVCVLCHDVLRSLRARVPPAPWVEIQLQEVIIWKCSNGLSLRPLRALGIPILARLLL
jgi:hypothetical protein